jgi:hypothetical protein
VKRLKRVEKERIVISLCLNWIVVQKYSFSTIKKSSPSAAADKEDFIF